MITASERIIALCEILLRSSMSHVERGELQLFLLRYFIDNNLKIIEKENVK